MRTQGLVPGSDEGGTPSGFFTGATGVTVYRGDAFPAEFRGNLFVGEVSNNLIHRAIPEPRGLLVTARDAEPGREFVASRDCYFRPVQMANAPDGCLWVVDMCRELIEGAAFLPPQILKHMDVSSGVDRGRIWRIVPDGHQPRIARLSKATTAELVALLEHPNGWHRDTASRLLYQRQDRSAVPALATARRPDSKQPVGRAHALSALAGPRRRSSRATSWPRLGDPDPRVRAHALRLAEPFCRADERISEPDGGDGRRSRPDGPLPARVLAGRAAGHAGRPGTGRAGDPRRVRSLDADGDPELGDDLHRRGLHAAGRRRRLPDLGARACLPDGPGRADRRGRSGPTTWPRSSRRWTARWPASRPWRVASSWP